MRGRGLRPTHAGSRMLGLILGLILVAPLFAFDSAFAAREVQGPPRAIRENVAPYTAIPTNVPDPITFKYPNTTNIQNTWLGELTTDCNLRYGAGPSYGYDRTWLEGRRLLVYDTALAPSGEPWYRVMQYPDPELYLWSGCVKQIAPVKFSTARHQGKWVDVNLSQQVLVAYENNKPVLVAQVATGKPGFETPVGSWRIYWRLPEQDMDGGGVVPGDAYYNMKDVPWVQYFNYTGVALHGQYWHDNLGMPLSHGCVNLTYGNSNWLYLWANNGTRVEVHN